MTTVGRDGDAVTPPEADSDARAGEPRRMTTEAMRRSPITGHGRRALQLQRADVANQWSNYSAVAAALFSTVSRDLDVDLSRLEVLTKRTRAFADVIEELQDADPADVRTYSELVPVEVWQSAAEDVEIQADLAQRLRTILDRISQRSVGTAELVEESKRFDEMAESFRRLGRELVESPADRAESQH
jgi:hypothetical protein